VGVSPQPGRQRADGPGPTTKGVEWPVGDSVRAREEHAAAGEGEAATTPRKYRRTCLPPTTTVLPHDLPDRVARRPTAPPHAPGDGRHHSYLRGPSN